MAAIKSTYCDCVYKMKRSEKQTNASTLEFVSTESSRKMKSARFHHLLFLSFLVVLIINCVTNWVAMSSSILLNNPHSNDDKQKIIKQALIRNGDHTTKEAGNKIETEVKVVVNYTEQTPEDKLISTSDVSSDRKYSKQGEEEEEEEEKDIEEIDEEVDEEIEEISFVSYPNDPQCKPSNSESVQKVHILSNAEEGYESEYRHVILDGVEQSSRLKSTTDMNDPDAIWIVDEVRFDCIEDLIPTILKRWNEVNSSFRQPWNIVLMSFHDVVRLEKTCFLEITKIFRSNKYLYYATRGATEDRWIQIQEGMPEDTPFRELGSTVDFTRDLLHKQQSGSFLPYRCSVHPLLYGVRSDLVKTIDDLQNDPMFAKWKKRPKDAVHFWEIDNETETGYLRNNVTAAMVEFASLPENKGYSITTEQFGKMKSDGRNNVTRSYAIELISHKIIVVCQRDWWEDHYRLMEAFAGGALVMTDPMHPLPAGIVDATHVVVYDSILDLKNHLKYYLEHEEERSKIAKAGHDVAMNHHRSWHIMEDLVFGNWDEPYGAFVDNS